MSNRLNVINELEPKERLEIIKTKGLGCLIKKIVHQTSEEQIAAVTNDPFNERYVKNPTPETREKIDSILVRKRYY